MTLQQVKLIYNEIKQVCGYGGGGETLQRGTKGTSFWVSVPYLDWIGHIGVYKYTLKTGTFYVCKFKLNKIDL